MILYNHTNKNDICTTIDDDNNHSNNNDIHTNNGIAITTTIP